nr:par-3 family cell polarity regulator beta a isoform X2 [Nothobranchius furzeri]
MKVTVTFGDTSVVVPCKAGWSVRDLVDQATRRYRRALEQEGDVQVNIHHLEYADGGILDMDDELDDLVEDREKLVAVFDDDQCGGSESPNGTVSNGDSSSATSPEPMHYFPHLEYEDPNQGEIEVNEAVLKSNTPLVVRSNSDSVLGPLQVKTPTPPPDETIKPPEPEMSSALRGALDRLQTNSPSPKMNRVHFSTLTRTVQFPGDRGPLGIHVIPYVSSLSGRTLGLNIKGIEENSRTMKENLFKVDESIVQINDVPLQDKTFAQSQEVFRQAMSSSSVRLEVLPAANKPRYEKSLIGQLFTGDGKDSPSATMSPMMTRSRANALPELKQNPKVEIKQPEMPSKTQEPVVLHTRSLQAQPELRSLESASPTPPAAVTSSSPTPRMTNQSPVSSKNPGLPALSNVTNTKGGKRMKIDLKKGLEGLGFTVVTRDSTVHGPGPILVKSILPRGAAIKDGRLQPGDRILEVNGVDMTGRSQEELVAMLRSTKQGESVSVVVARQEDMFLPRELGQEVSGQVTEDGKEQLMYEIPLNETGSAGLGLSLKGNKSKETGEDLGIFIKSIIHGGAAYKDGRLCVNDQMIAVNGESLLGHSNHSAMETLRRSMSSEGNARGTIQLVVLRGSQQTSSGNSALNTATNISSSQPNVDQAGSNYQEPRGPDAHQRPSGPTRTPNPESTVSGTSHALKPTNSYSGSAPAAFTNGSYGNYSNDDEHGFPLPPSPDSMEEMNRDLPLTPPQHSEPPNMPAAVYPNRRFISDEDDVPRNRTSKCMDMVADESNLGSWNKGRSSGGALGPTLGLVKSSSLESLQTAMSEANHNRVQAQVPIHRPRPHMVRGRGCNQSFRIAIDKSYEGPSEDDDDLSEYSSGNETPASTSSRQDLDEDDGKKKKKTKGKKKEKKIKGKKKTEDSGDDLEKKTKKKGFGLLRFGKKKDDKNKGSKTKLNSLSEEELDRVPDNRDGYDPRVAEALSGYTTPDQRSLPDMDDDDSDPHYARINKFRQQLSPHSPSRTPSPAIPAGGQSQLQMTPEDVEGLYAKVNKFRAPPASQNQAQPDRDQHAQGLQKEHQQARAAPGYEELDTARRRFLEYDPQRTAPRGAESRPRHRYEEIDLDYAAQPRRDLYDYPTHRGPVPRDQVPPYPGQYQDPPVSSNAGRSTLPQSQQPPSNACYHPSAQQHRAALRQDVPPSPTTGTRGRPYNDADKERHYRQASPGRYIDSDRYPKESPGGYQYGDKRGAEPRRKNVLIDAV